MQWSTLSSEAVAEKLNQLRRMPQKNAILQIIHDANKKEMLKQAEIDAINIQIKKIRQADLKSVDTARNELIAKKKKSQRAGVPTYTRMFTH